MQELAATGGQGRGAISAIASFFLPILAIVAVVLGAMLVARRDTLRGACVMATGLILAVMGWQFWFNRAVVQQIESSSPSSTALPSEAALLPDAATPSSGARPSADRDERWYTPAEAKAAARGFCGITGKNSLFKGTQARGNVIRRENVDEAVDIVVQALVKNNRHLARQPGVRDDWREGCRETLLASGIVE